MARVLISMSNDFLNRVDTLATSEQRTRSELIREALRVYIKRNRISNNLKAEENAALLSELLGQVWNCLQNKKLTVWSVISFSQIILGGDLGIVDTWHATTNF